MADFGLLSVLLVGLLGGVHCVGMCGGIVTAFSLRRDGQVPGFAFHLSYNLGRIASYTFIGALGGALGRSLSLTGLAQMQNGLYVLAQFVLILLGLYLAGWSSWVLVFERAGGALWRRLQPLFARLLPVRTLPQALLAGAVWGWLPCGLVYSVLISTLAAGGAAGGAALMLAFGLGTLPNLLGVGVFAASLKPFMQNLWVRRGAGLMVAAFGVWGLIALILRLATTASA